MPGLRFRSKTSKVHQAHIALSGPTTSIDQQGSSLGSCPTFPSLKPALWLTLGSLTLCRVIFCLVGGRDKYHDNYVGNRLKVCPRVFASKEMLKGGISNVHLISRRLEEMWPRDLHWCQEYNKRVKRQVSRKIRIVRACVCNSLLHYPTVQFNHNIKKRKEADYILIDQCYLCYTTNIAKHFTYSSKKVKLLTWGTETLNSNIFNMCTIMNSPIISLTVGYWNLISWTFNLVQPYRPSSWWNLTICTSIAKIRKNELHVLLKILTF